MKQVFFNVMLLISMFLLISCSSSDKQNMVFSINEEGKYSGFDSIKDIESTDEAVKNGYYVIDNGKFIGDEHWKNFIEASSNNENAGLRIVEMVESTGNNYVDLFFHDGLYYSFDREINDIDVNGYKYLLTLESDTSLDGKKSFFTILSNDNAITFSECRKDAFSSEKIVDKEKYKVLFFGEK